MDLQAGYGNTCRICLKKDELMQLSIFDMINDNITYSDMLTIVLHPVPIDMNPKLPQKLCQMCIENLVKVFNLRQLCFTSDRWVKSTIYGDLYLNANGFAVSSAPNDDNAVIGTMVIDGDSDIDEASSIPGFLLSTLQYNAPEVILQDSFDTELPSDKILKLKPSSDQANKEMLICDICRRKFTTINGYLRHNIRKHNADGHGLHKCELCLLEFTTNRGLKTHYRTLKHKQKAQIETTSYICKRCSTEFRSLEEYSKHMLKHMVVRMDLKNNVCQICGNSYSAERSFKRHMVKHLSDVK